MPKALLFTPFLFLLALFAFFAFIFIKLVSKKIKKQKASAWTGKLIDKTHVEIDDNDSSFTSDHYTLVFQTDAGKKVNVAVSLKIYNDYKIGDRAEKVPGELRPRKLN